MSRYPDIEGHLFQQDIDDLDARGLVGVPDGADYRPDDSITRGESAAYLNRMLTYLGDTVEPPVEPPIEPPVEPPVEPPTGMFIPGHNGAPILGAPANAETVNGSALGDGRGTITIRNKKIRGKFTYGPGTTLIVEDCDWDGLGGNVCGHGLGGKPFVKRTRVFNAEDGFKNTVDLEQVWIGDLYYRSGAHGDCVQAEGTADITARWCNFQAFYANGNLANAAFMVKTDFSPNQKVRVYDSLMNGGNYTFKTNTGPAGGTPDCEIRRSFYGGESRYGSHAGPGINVWDVTDV